MKGSTLTTLLLLAILSVLIITLGTAISTELLPGKQEITAFMRNSLPPTPSPNTGLPVDWEGAALFYPPLLQGIPTIHTWHQLRTRTPLRSGIDVEHHGPTPVHMRALHGPAVPSVSPQELADLKTDHPALFHKLEQGEKVMASHLHLASLRDEWQACMWALPTVHFRWGGGMGPPNVQYSVLHRDPHILKVTNVLDAATCLRLIEIGQQTMAPSRTVTRRPGEAQYNAIRTSYSGLLAPPETSTKLTPFITGVLLRVAHVMGTLPQFIERIQVVRYIPGQFFKIHNDFIVSKEVVAHSGQRSKTLFVYLNALPEGERGGRTQFTNLKGGSRQYPWTRHPEHAKQADNFLDCVPEQGSGILWANMLPGGDVDFRTMHQGTELKGGGNQPSVKFGLNVWVRTMSQPYRREQLHGNPKVPAGVEYVDRSQ